MSGFDALRSKAPLDEGVTARLDAPHVGVFVPGVALGDAVTPGRVIGRLVVLGRSHPVRAPHGANGAVLSVAAYGPVEYGQELGTLGAATTATEGGAAAEAAADDAAGYAIVAPIDGIFYARPSPDAPAYVNVGDRVTTGTTLGLVEVMKTFNPVSLGGPGAPTEGTISAVLASDGDEVSANEVLFRIVAE